MTGGVFIISQSSFSQYIIALLVAGGPRVVAAAGGCSPQPGPRLRTVLRPSPGIRSLQGIKAIFNVFLICYFIFIYPKKN